LLFGIFLTQVVLTEMIFYWLLTLANLLCKCCWIWAQLLTQLTTLSSSLVWSTGWAFREMVSFP